MEIRGGVWGMDEVHGRVGEEYGGEHWAWKKRGKDAKKMNV